MIKFEIDKNPKKCLKCKTINHSQNNVCKQCGELFDKILKKKIINKIRLVRQ